jgi:hypothetical protein
VHVISACADQSELINATLPPTAIHNPYHILEVLPGGEKDMTNMKYTTALQDGSQKLMLPLLGISIIETMKNAVWNDKPTVFGLRVGFIKSIHHSSDH